MKALVNDESALKLKYSVQLVNARMKDITDYIESSNYLWTRIRRYCVVIFGGYYFPCHKSNKDSPSLYI